MANAVKNALYIQVHRVVDRCGSQSAKVLIEGIIKTSHR